MEMAFVSVGSHAVPILLEEGSVPDGILIFNLEQAMRHFTLDAELLTRIWRTTFAKHLAPEPVQEFLPPPKEEPEVTEETIAEQTIRDVKIATLKNSKYPKLPMHHFEHFIRVCEERGLSPWAEQVFCRLDKGPNGEESLKIIVGINGMRLIADRTGERDGSDPAAYTFDHDGALASASVTVYRFYQGRRVSYTGVVDFAEYYPGEGKDSLWDRMPKVCLKRCAEAAALREAFAQELGGIYTHEEMAQAKAYADAKAKKKKRRESLVDSGLPTSARSLEMFLVEKLNVTNKANRAEVMERLKKEFDLGDDPAAYAAAAEAVANDLAKYGLT
jgi:phage recombination protein Bet